MPLTKTTREKVISKGYRAMKNTLKDLKAEGLHIATPLNGTKQELTLALIWITEISACEGYVDLVHSEWNCIHVSGIDGKKYYLYLFKEELDKLWYRHRITLDDIQPHDYLKFQGRLNERDCFYHCDITGYKEKVRQEKDCTQEQLNDAYLHHFIFDKLKREKERFNNWMVDNFYSAGDRYYLSINPDNYLYYTLPEIKAEFNKTS